MELGTYYTTNQDNVMELLYEQSGRPLQVVADLADIAERSPYKTTLYKYHGVLTKPETIVFTAQDYRNRIAQRAVNPLDIRIRSDVLGKSLVFLGYSFGDPNVRLLMSELQNAFRRLPLSFFVQYSPNSAMARALSQEYGMHVITPSNLYPKTTNSQAFEMFLSDLGDRVLQCRTERDIQDLFYSPSPPERVLSQRELNIIANAATQSQRCQQLVDLFRTKVDGTRIPKDLEAPVVELFTDLCRLATNSADAQSLGGALFNMRFSEAGTFLNALMALMATGNVYTDTECSGMPFLPAVKIGKKEDFYVFAAAGSIALLQKWGRTITPGLHYCFSYWGHAFLPRKKIPSAVLADINQAFEWAYSGSVSTYPNPLDEADRRAALLKPFSSPSFSEIRANLFESLRKHLVLPANE